VEEIEVDAALQRLVDRQEIRDVLSRYCRALDRMDKEMAYAVWHEGGTAFYDGIYEGTGRGFIDWVWQAHAAMERHSHQITNVLIELNGDRAISEAYVTVALWTLPDADGLQKELVGRGRYLDRFSKKHGRWAIEHRTHLLDMSSARDLERAEVSEGASRDATDLSFEFFTKS
jgi:DNA-binding GntR family transcriptional regulator